MTTSEALRLAFSPLLFVALGLLAYIGIKYSQGKELPRRARLRIVGIAGVVMLIAVSLYVASWLI
ncbi:hypothetical protein EDF38_0275 [Frigoribacterium sp. PhB160]|uniref:hypothetical protein n=1 Tax=Frigoribacterium sp. PhB160 TaxID=2485192 RepID=UPI000F4634F8|nr:hypothetical protein [Frigoribacterium sp. PhB160]ROS61190.1 hypothetical protein EDF38_0275 [Frigoribacterium sp. PhB160]